MQIVIYTSEVTNRLKYILDFIFVQYFGVEYFLETDIVVFKKKLLITEFIGINYSNHEIDNGLNIPCESLLFETNIQTQKVFISKVGEMPVLFPSENFKQGFPFDIFAAIFYLISRYEEYLPHEQDEHGRYCSYNSILSNPVFNFSPIVETWLAYLKTILLERKPNIPFKIHHFKKLFTFDIDNAFQYKHRNWFKNPPNVLKKEVRNVLLGKEPDAYDNFDELFQFCTQLEHKPFFFFLLNDNGKRNSNVHPNASALHSIIRTCKDFKLGIHNSYHFLERNLISENKKLAEIVNFPITYSRQHFLKISFPYYFRLVSEQGITKDFSLGYPNISGCRAGTTQSFLFFDIIKDEQTSLWIQPFIFMDATYQYYQIQNIDTIQQKVEKLLLQIQRINGNFVILFHNDLLQDRLPYKKLLSFIQQY